MQLSKEELKKINQIKAMFDEEDIDYINIEKYLKIKSVNAESEEKNKTKEKIYDKKNN